MSVADQLGKIFSRNPATPDGAPGSDAAAHGLPARAPEPATVAISTHYVSPSAPSDGAAPAATPLDVPTPLDAAKSGDGGKAVFEDSKLVALPVLGRATIDRHQRVLYTILGVGLLALAGLAATSLTQANRSAQQLAATGQALMQSQRLAKSVTQAIIGIPQAFPDVAESFDVLSRTARALDVGDDGMRIAELSSAYRAEFGEVAPLIERTDRNAKVVLSQEKILTQVGAALRTINRQSSDLLEIAETVSALKLQQNASPGEVSAAGQLAMLTQRVGKSANEFQTSEGVSPEAVFLLGKDLNSFREITQGLLDGSSELRLTAARDSQVREQLQALLTLYEKTRFEAGAILGNLQGLVSAREAQTAIIADSEPMRRGLEVLQQRLSQDARLSLITVLAMAVIALVVLAAAFGLARVLLLDSRSRQSAAESQRQEAEQQQYEAERAQLEAKRVNDANQAAILRLMNELQTVAEGDLTQEATVTEDITGAIADSVNYTVEELRLLVGNVQNTVTRVAQTTAQVDSTSTELLAASTEQLREIRETGRSVLDMASRINGVSSQAQESAAVARQSLEAADSGLQAVQNAIGGMNAIRDQIQDTSKRIKRLGESSQEIGEITELISDITEQTNVLALNAAIQAASAGEAGRGFSVVAEEVQRLAERSGDATRQISALVRAIQTDTQDAVAAMERSTQGVVDGARLSDSAGTALTEIDRVSRRLADLIEHISSSTSREAELANVVADNIQHIFAVTEQTGEGTRTTAQQVRELSRMAEDLRESVARFKIA
ncbi:methyl-accepting chemotaxis protein [Xylophilus ampelinus]|uniref:Twitching motility protein PilJ n=1 Tax=Xylophilus ampelinus TaxID=54067 RepID=A0A318SQH9_9BURK|nr:methyl-accepting chemotaxis protein [Xylophilus ampelinus]MCS4511522.1 methyl-accepting chemotaxis protein [Xylophilus ampelinus]PYE74355.1 twitching motility protein PilJ [Xylophilus ampelinus]